jgi:hypothetical protein
VSADALAQPRRCSECGLDVATPIERVPLPFLVRWAKFFVGLAAVLAIVVWSVIELERPSPYPISGVSPRFVVPLVSVAELRRIAASRDGARGRVVEPLRGLVQQCELSPVDPAGLKIGWQMAPAEGALSIDRGFGRPMYWVTRWESTLGSFRLPPPHPSVRGPRIEYQSVAILICLALIGGRVVHALAKMGRVRASRRPLLRAGGAMLAAGALIGWGVAAGESEETYATFMRSLASGSASAAASRAIGDGVSGPAPFSIAMNTIRSPSLTDALIAKEIVDALGSRADVSASKFLALAPLPDRDPQTATTWSIGAPLSMAMITHVTFQRGPGSTGKGGSARSPWRCAFERIGTLIVVPGTPAVQIVIFVSALAAYALAIAALRDVVGGAAWLGVRLRMVHRRRSSRCMRCGYPLPGPASP